MAREDIPLDQVGPNFDGGEENWRERKIGKKREEGGERSSTFSLDFSAIGPLVWVGVRGKVGPRIESYAWVPK